jgi:hypothetical protein
VAERLSRHWEKHTSRTARTSTPLLLQEGKLQAEAAQAVIASRSRHRKINHSLGLIFTTFVLIFLSAWPTATKRRRSMYSTSIAPESTKPPASLIRDSSRIIIDYRSRIYWNRSIVEENVARGDRHGNREAKKPKKLKPKEVVPVSAFALIQKKALEAANPKKK